MYKIPVNNARSSLLEKLHLDPWLLALLLTLAATGLFILYSASNSHLAVVEQQALRLALGFGVMCLFAQIPPHLLRHWSTSIFILCLILLVAVLLFGQTSQGARRWLNLIIFRFQPSELMKLALPLLLCHYLSHYRLPPPKKVIAIAALILLVPVLLTAKQPDLGTAILIATAGIFVILLAGLPWKLMAGTAIAGVMSTPVLWHLLHQYQRDRILVLLSPERDPQGKGYHIIQSKIALGSGGLWGKGYLAGTQAHLQFLPAHTTDFIFAVAGEEFGLLGSIAILLLFAAILYRCLLICVRAQDHFTRLLSGSLSLTFFVSALINVGMVIGVLPVVGVPLPLISYGGSSLLTVMAAFGMIMSIQTHRKLISS